MSALLAPGELVVLRLPNWLGDAVMAEPLVRAALERQRVRLIAPERVLALWPTLGANVERVVIAPDRPERASDHRDARASILLTGSTRSAWCAFHARVPVRAGFARGARRLFLTHALRPALERGGSVPGRGPRGRGARLLPRPFTLAVRELGTLAGVPVSAARPRLSVDAEALRRARERLDRALLARPVLLVHAGARPGSAKGVPPAHFARLVARVAEERALAAVLCCAPGEEANARAVHAELGGRALLLDDPAPGVEELVAWSALAALVLTPDNGARHVAQALGKPVIALCGPTDPRHTDEHASNVCVLRGEVECGPCHRERCPFTDARERACFERIGLDAVVRAARELGAAVPENASV